jgi:outer membrane lipoprotein-sorting protein
MSQSLKTLLKLSIAGALVGLLVGCATQAQLDEISAKADAAMDEASTAMVTAEGAETIANSNSEKIDRMFERQMYK